MVKGVATSIITLAVLMGSLVACGGSDNQFSEEEKNDWIILCSSVAVDGTNCPEFAQLMEELISEDGYDKDCTKEEMLILVATTDSDKQETQARNLKSLCRPNEEERSLSDESESSPPPTSTPVPTAEPEPTPTPAPEPTPTLEPTTTPQTKYEVIFESDGELFLMGVDDSNVTHYVTQLTNIKDMKSDEYTYEFAPYGINPRYDDFLISPDGEKIAYKITVTSVNRNEDDSLSSFQELWALDIDSAETIRLVTSKSGEEDSFSQITGFQWSPDSSQLFVLANWTDGYYFQQDLSIRKEWDGDCWIYGLFSPDPFPYQVSLAYVRHGSTSTAGGQITLGGMNCDSTSRPITNQEDPDKGFDFLQWSPDGTKVAARYEYCYRECRGHLYVAPRSPDNNECSDTEVPCGYLIGQITSGEDGYIGPNFDWSPDSNKIIFEDAMGKISVVLSEDGILKFWQLGEGNSPKFSPDGEKIVLLLHGEIFVQNDASPTLSNRTSTGQRGSWAIFRP